MGFLPGMVLGAGAVRAWVAWRAGEIGETRWLLIGHGAFVLVPCAVPIVFGFIGALDDLTIRGWRATLIDSASGFYFNFPFQIAPHDGFTRLIYAFCARVKREPV